jgi:hypothetical protein
MRRAESGLTLLEVLGAVALLAIVYITLAGAAMEGLRQEGESRRRLEASLLADERMADLELALAAGTLPPIGRSEEQVEAYTVVTEVRPFEPPPPPSPAEAARDGEPDERPSPLHPKRGAISLFAPPGAGAQPALRTLDIVVRWTEGIDAREVRRTTWAVDAAAAQVILEAALQVSEERAGEQLAKDRESKLDRKQRKQEARDAFKTAPFEGFELPDPKDLPQGPQGDE